MQNLPAKLLTQVSVLLVNRVNKVTKSSQYQYSLVDTQVDTSCSLAGSCGSCGSLLVGCTRAVGSHFGRADSDTAEAPALKQPDSVRCRRSLVRYETTDQQLTSVSNVG